MSDSMKYRLIYRDEAFGAALQDAFAPCDNVKVVGGDILEAACDAIVSPANSFGFMDGGLDYQLSERLGWSVQDRLQEMIRQLPEGELLVGKALVLETGHEAFPYLISAPTMRVPMSFNIATSVNAYLAMKAILIEARAHPEIRSVSIPGLCTGIGRMPPGVAARQMFAAFSEIELGQKPDFADFGDAQKHQLHLNEAGMIYGQGDIVKLKIDEKPDALKTILVPGPDADRTALSRLGDFKGHCLELGKVGGGAISLTHVGTRADLANEPINIVSTNRDARARLISNLAHTPFVLDGRDYASVEGFWQGLKFEDEARRADCAILHGMKAKAIGKEAAWADTLRYGGETVRVGTHEHWRLMALACIEKFEQDEQAREALLATGDRPLVHKVKRDSLTIPGVIMADIWMRIRARLRGRAEPGGEAT